MMVLVLGSVSQLILPSFTCFLWSPFHPPIPFLCGTTFKSLVTNMEENNFFNILQILFKFGNLKRRAKNKYFGHQKCIPSLLFWPNSPWLTDLYWSSILFLYNHFLTMSPETMRCIRISLWHSKSKTYKVNIQVVSKLRQRCCFVTNTIFHISRFLNPKEQLCCTSLSKSLSLRCWVYLVHGRDVCGLEVKKEKTEFEKIKEGENPSKFWSRT